MSVSFGTRVSTVVKERRKTKAGRLNWLYKEELKLTEPGQHSSLDAVILDSRPIAGQVFLLSFDNYFVWE